MALQWFTLQGFLLPKNAGLVSRRLWSDQHLSQRCCTSDLNGTPCGRHLSYDPSNHLVELAFEIWTFVYDTKCLPGEVRLFLVGNLLGCHDHDGQSFIARIAAQVIEEGRAIHLRHHEIEQNEIRCELLKHLQCDHPV